MKKLVRIGLNGFGRIGRVATRIILDRPKLSLVAVNSRADVSSHAYLLQHDSTYGTYLNRVNIEKNNLIIKNHKIATLNYENPADIPWDEYGVDIVIDATGKFRKSLELSNHLKKGVKAVIISAPAKDDTKTLVFGVNQFLFDPKKDNIISNSSCTTNCLATVLWVLHQKFIVKRGFMTTIHAVTDSQNLLDNSHKSQVRLRRSAFASIIPSSTGSAKDICKLFPELYGKIACGALRIPLLTVSMINLTVETDRNTTKEEINHIFEEASRKQLKGILDVAKEELVSIDYTGNPYSAVIDPFLTQVISGNLVNIYAWYDNEWGYTNRLIDMVEFIAAKKGL